MEKIIIFDTTLRDGEQAPGASLNQIEKLEIASALADLGVDVIEAGFPVSSQGELESVKQIARIVKGSVICGLARAIKKDIDAAHEAVKQARHPRIHVFLATSKIHMQYKLKKAEEEILRLAVEAVRYARKYCNDIEFSPEDASRSERQFLFKIIQAVIEVGATVVNIPDTVGYTEPEEFGSLIKAIKENVSNIDQAIISVHCHNDLGLAVANSLSAVKNGARQVECTVNGIGERAGNASMEEIIMALRTRRDVFADVDTHIKTTGIYKVSRLVSKLTGFVVAPNKAVVGGNAFRHESGIHQDGILKERTTYEIIKPADVGFTGSGIVLGKHSGRHALQKKLTDMGYALDKDALEKAYKRLLQIADKKKDISERDLEIIVAEEIYVVPEEYKIESIDIKSGTHIKPEAKVILNHKGEVIEKTVSGAGPVDAVYKALEKLTKVKASLVDYSIQAITGGTDALGEVTVRIKDKDRIYVGHGADTDILIASAKAYLAAINRLIAQP